MANNYVVNHDMYFMNHKNGDVLKVTVDRKDHSLKNLRLYRQDGFGHYYFDKNAEAKNLDNLKTKEDVIKAGKKIGAHNTHHIEKWHHEVKPVYNSQHKIIDFEPKLNLEHHKQVQNAKRFLHHADDSDVDYLFELYDKGLLGTYFHQIMDWIYRDRNKEVVIAHKIHKVEK